MSLAARLRRPRRIESQRATKRKPRAAIDPAGFFVAVSLLFGAAMALAIPVGNTPDEVSHIARSYEVARLHLVASKVGNDIGLEMPASLIDPSPRTAEGADLRNYPSVKLTPREAWNPLVAPLRPTVVTFRSTAATAPYSPVGYLPQALAVAFGVAFGLPPGLIYLAARLSVLAVHTALGFATIRLWPQKPWGLTAILLLPMMIAQSISPGIDAILISLGGLMTALVLKLRLNRDGNPIRVRAVIGLVALAAATCLTKPVMVLFPALFWMIPTRRLPGRHPRIGKAIMIALPVLAGATWSLAMSAWIGPIGASDAHNASAQLDHIVHHPLTLITAFVRTWYTDMGGIVVRSFAGIFGYLDTSLPLWLDVVVYLAIGAYLWTYRRPVVNLARGERIFLAVAAFAFFYLNSLALYLVWTVPGTRYMDGLQGRYLLPALFLLLPVAPAAARLSRRGAAIVFRGLPVALLAISLLYIVERYYVSPLGELAQVL